MLEFAVLATEEIDPEGNQSIGWLPGLYVLGLCIVIGLLLWSFAKMARKAREPWEGEDTDASSEDDPPRP